MRVFLWKNTLWAKKEVCYIIWFWIRWFRNDTDIQRKEQIRLTLCRDSLFPTRTGLYSLDLLFTVLSVLYGFRGDSDGKKKSACNAGDPGSIPGVRKMPWRRDWLPAPVFLPGESHGQRRLADSSPWGHNSWGNACFVKSSVIQIDGTIQHVISNP